MLLGKGCNSEVYTNDNDTVIMTGKFSRDMFKLAVHAQIGKLRSIHKNGDNYQAIIERMYDIHQQSPDETDQLYALMDIVDRLNMQNHNGFEFLRKLSQVNNLALQTIAQFILTLDLALNQLDFWVDNDTPNWLVDNSGNPIPFDLFDFDQSELSRNAQITIVNLLAQYME